MLYTAKTEIDATEWNQFVKQHPQATFFQLSQWGELKSDFGWEAQRIGVYDEAGKLVAGTQILYRPLPYRLGKLAYIPFGPVVDWHDETVLKVLFRQIDKVARHDSVAFLKMEPGYNVPEDVLKRYFFKESAQTIQPPRTIMLTIAGRDKNHKIIDTDDILKGMNQGTRRNIRKAEKQNVADTRRNPCRY